MSVDLFVDHVGEVLNEFFGRNMLERFAVLLLGKRNRFCELIKVVLAEKCGICLQILNVNIAQSVKKAGSYVVLKKIFC